MKDKLVADLKKYEMEIEHVNKKLAESDEQRSGLIAHGRRVEGIVAYIRALLAAEDKGEKAKEGSAA